MGRSLIRKFQLQAAACSRSRRIRPEQRQNAGRRQRLGNKSKRSGTVFLGALLLLALAPAAKGGGSDWDAALKLYQEGEVRRAAEAFSELAGRTTDVEVRGQALNNACALLNDLADFRESHELCREAVAIRRDDSPQGLPRALNNLAVSLQGIGAHSEAIAALGEALELNRDAQDSEGVAVNLLNLGINNQLLGHYEVADQHFLDSIGLCLQHESEPWASQRQALAQLNRSGLLERLGRFEQALEILDVLLDRKHDGTPLSAPLLATAELNRGVIYRNLGDPLLALESFERALKLYQTMGSQSGVASVRLNSALAYHLGLNDPKTAHSLLTEAIELASEQQDALLQIEALFTRGQVSMATAELETARADFDQSLELSRASGSGIGLWSSLFGLSRVERAKDNPGAALERLTEALGSMERQATGLTRGRESTFLAGQRTVYEAAIAATLAGQTQPDSESVDRAYLLVQRYKARALTDSLRQTSHDQTTASGLSDLQDLKNGINGTTLLELFSFEGRLGAWVLGGPSPNVRFADLGETSVITSLIQQLNRSLLQDSPDEDALARLGQALLDRPLGLAAGHQMPREILIAPDAALWQVPFDLLPVQVAGDRPIRLIDIAAVRATQSGFSMLKLMSRAEIESDTNYEGWALGTEASKSHGVVPLPNASTEVTSTARTMGGLTALFVGDDTSEATLRQKRPPTLVRHFATHTMLDDRAGLASRLLLAPTNHQAGPDHDGLLSPADISGLSLPAELTVLAACTTSGQPAPDGDGALGTFAGAFLVAGSNAVLATLWDVSDDSSAVLLEQFYYHLANGKPAAMALRLAKLALANDRRWANPRNWAGWVLIGQSPTLPSRLPKSLPLFYAGLLALLALMGVLIIRRSKKVVQELVPGASDE